MADVTEQVQIPRPGPVGNGPQRLTPLELLDRLAALVPPPAPSTIPPLIRCSSPPRPSSSTSGRDRNAARAALGKGLAVSAFPRYVPV